MRVLHVIPSMDPAGGGPPAVVLGLASATFAAGHQPTIISYGHSGAEERIVRSFKQVPHFDSIPRKTLAEPSRVERIIGRGARGFFSEVVKEFDFVHMHGMWESLLPAAAAAARQAGKPYAVAPHGMLHPWSLQQRRLKKKLALAMGYRSMLNGAAFIHALNQEEGKALASIGVSAPVEIIPNGIFLEDFAALPAKGSFSRSHPALANKPYILFLSRLHYKKGLDVLADAFGIVAGQLPEAQLVIAGPDDGALADFNARIDRGGLASRTHVVGPLYGSEKLAALVDATCFCLPSRQEGFSMAITEAMAIGTPVVISEGCHFPEVARSGAGEVVKLDAGEVATALVRALSNSERREQMSAAGQKLVREHYTWPIVAGRTVEMYRKGMSRASASPTRTI